MGRTFIHPSSSLEIPKHQPSSSVESKPSTTSSRPIARRNTMAWQRCRKATSLVPRLLEIAKGNETKQAWSQATAMAFQARKKHAFADRTNESSLLPRNVRGKTSAKTRSQRSTRGGIVLQNRYVERPQSLLGSRLLSRSWLWRHSRLWEENSERRETSLGFVNWPRIHTVEPDPAIDVNSRADTVSFRCRDNNIGACDWDLNHYSSGANREEPYTRDIIWRVQPRKIHSRWS